MYCLLVHVEWAFERENTFYSKRTHSMYCLLVLVEWAFESVCMCMRLRVSFRKCLHVHAPNKALSLTCPVHVPFISKCILELSWLISIYWKLSAFECICTCMRMLSACDPRHHSSGLIRPLIQCIRGLIRHHSRGLIRPLIYPLMHWCTRMMPN
jgi:hypothetical protein